jgi:predicted amidophosphoribosyltransferase
MEDQPFGELLSARRCWACCSDDLTELTWAIIDQRLICGVCIRGRDIPRTVACYRGRSGSPRRSLRAAYEAIVAFKECRPGGDALGPVLAGALASAVTTVAAVHGLPNDTVLVPVPSYQDRRPHVARLCTMASRDLRGIRLLPCLHKIRDFRQARLGAAARSAASADAYCVKGRVKNRSIIIADDIMTTGATLAACANALYDKGAAEVYGAAIVRAIQRPRIGLVVFGSKQVRVRWTELDARGRTGISPGKTAIWVRFGCRKRCPHILTAGPFRVPALGTESLHAWSCECREKHAITLGREWQGENRERVQVRVADHQASELLVALRHYRP